MVHNRTIFLGARDRYADQLKWLDRVLATLPESPANVRTVVATNVLLGRDSVAEAWRRYAREREIALERREFSVSLFHDTDTDRARALVDSLADGEERVDQRQRRAALALYEGDFTEARRLYRRLLSASARALDWLEAAVEAGERDARSWRPSPP